MWCRTSRTWKWSDVKPFKVDVLLNVSVQTDMDKPLHLVVVNVFCFLLRVGAVDVAAELIQDITMAEDVSLQSLDVDVAMVLDVDVEVDSQDVVQVDVLDIVTVKPVHCSKTLVVLLVPAIAPLRSAIPGHSQLSSRC